MKVANTLIVPLCLDQMNIVTDYEHCQCHFVLYSSRPLALV